MLALTSISDVLQLVTSSTATTEVHASWIAVGASADVPARKNTTISTATTTAIIPSPPAGGYSAIKALTVSNRHASAAQTVTVILTDGVAPVTLFKVTLAAGETLSYGDKGRFVVQDSVGRERVASADMSGYVPFVGGVLTGHLSTVAGASGAQVPRAQDTAMLGSTIFGVRNRLINGNFVENQDAVSGTVVLAAGVYGHDMWKAGAAGCTYTFSTSSEGDTTLTILAGSLIQVIESANYRTGTYTLSWFGTAQGKIGVGAYGASGQSAAVTGGSNLSIEFNAGTLGLTQFEPGTVSGPFERIHPALNRLNCHWYYEIGKAGSDGYSSAANAISSYMKMNPKRAVPVITPSFTYSLNSSGGVIDNISKGEFRAYAIATGTGQVAFNVVWKASCRI